MIRPSAAASLHGRSLYSRPYRSIPTLYGIQASGRVRPAMGLPFAGCMESRTANAERDVTPQQTRSGGAENVSMTSR